MGIVLRFAPSPTGFIHIGNIRTAIFNWLYARHADGRFLLRIEDTDKERSTREAIDALLECMTWLGLDYDGEIYYQSQHEAEHVAAAKRLLSEGKAYCPPAPEGQAAPIVFRIPWDTANVPAVREVGETTLETHPDAPLVIGMTGVKFAATSRKGKPEPREACLAGFRGLKVFDTDNRLVFELEKEIDAVLSGERSFSFERPGKIVFTRREVFYEDRIKGPLSKPLDSIKDLVIARADGSPVFHLANVLDDIAQGVTHIMRGDDHVENTYRHILLFAALGHKQPEYAHMPMIVNQQGKPYSKRDGDAFVGDFREKGYLPQALFNYLALLGWSPGDDREKMTLKEMVEAFSMERVKSSPAQFDGKKLANLNGLYMADLDFSTFLDEVWRTAVAQGWGNAVERSYFNRVAALSRSRLKLYADVGDWRYFFFNDYERDEAAYDKFVTRSSLALAAFSRLVSALIEMKSFTETNVELAIHQAEAEVGMEPGRLNQPLRVALTGSKTGAGIYETIMMLGKEKTIARLQAAIAVPPPTPSTPA